MVCGSRTQAAKAIGVSNATLTHKLTGKCPFTTKDIESLCEVLGIQKSEIVDYFFS